jgi:hypothetical protein
MIVLLFVFFDQCSRLLGVLENHCERLGKEHCRRAVVEAG